MPILSAAVSGFDPLFVVAFQEVFEAVALCSKEACCGISVPNEKISTQSGAKEECRQRRKGRKEKARIVDKKYGTILRCGLCEGMYEEPLRSLREIR